MQVQRTWHKIRKEEKRKDASRLNQRVADNRSAPRHELIVDE